MTIKEYSHFLHDKLDKIYGKDEAESFFYLIIEQYLKFDRIKLALNPSEKIKNSELPFFLDIAEKLEQQIPIQYIIGETEFYSLKYKVDKNVLIPRPETEELVDWIITDYKNYKSSLSILDVGTGSGCIAISLAKNLSNSQVSALDVSGDALKVAQTNSKLNNVVVKMLHRDILSIDPHDNSLGNYDIIVSNPPYVRVSEKDRMKDNVVKNEPELALFVKDEDPLIFYRKIIGLAQPRLKENGSLYFEINEYLSEELSLMLQQLGFGSIEVRKDIYGKDRMVKAKKE